MNPKFLLPLAIAAAGATYAAVIEPRWLQVRRSAVHIRRLPSGMEDLRVALLSDLHAGRLTPASVIRRAVRAVLAERPHIIAVTGDLSDDERGFGAVFDALAPLAAPLGVYAVPGNHDHSLGIDGWREAVEAHPTMQDLTNRSVVLRVRGARLCIAGLDDCYRGKPELHLPPQADRDLTLLLAHSPDQAEHIRRGGDAVDLVVGGHTHGGQVRLPFIGAPKSSSRHPELYEEGLRRRPWTQVYTTRGVGSTRLPIRFMTRPEVAILRLTSSPRARRSLAGSALARITG
jgi:uncharacterized protein